MLIMLASISENSMRFQKTEKAKILPIFKRGKGKNNKLKQNN